MISNFKSNPPFPLSKISFGPVGQFVDMIAFFKEEASSKTLGNPSNLEDKINKSLFAMNGYGLF